MSEVLDKYLAQQNGSGARIRVWSLVVTIFGDAIEPRGGVLRLGALQQITEHIGIGNNALRTAMSRLASDGWLERQRIGRASYYKPTPLASREIVRASRVIYRFFPQSWQGDWIFAVATKGEGFEAETKSRLHDSGFAFHSKNLAIAPNIEPDATSDCAQMNCLNDIKEITLFNTMSGQNGHDGKIADILKNVSFYEDCYTLYDEFSNSTATLLEDVKNSGKLEALDAMLLRSLLVHQWRRIALKDVRWPRELRSKNWPGFGAQSLVGELYNRLLEPSEIWLSDLDATPQGKLPEAEDVLRQRFSS